MDGASDYRDTRLSAPNHNKLANQIVVEDMLLKPVLQTYPHNFNSGRHSELV